MHSRAGPREDSPSQHEQRPLPHLAGGRGWRGQQAIISHTHSHSRFNACGLCAWTRHSKRARHVCVVELCPREKRGVGGDADSFFLWTKTHARRGTNAQKRRRWKAEQGRIGIIHQKNQPHGIGEEGAMRKAGLPGSESFLKSGAQKCVRCGGR